MMWDDKADGLLIQLWDEGGSLGSVAEGMRKAGYDVTRSAVAGRRHRLMPEGFNRKSPSTKTVRPASKPGPKPKIRKEGTVTKKIPTVVEALEVVTTHVGIEYLKLPASGCKAIMPGRGGKWKLHLVCGRLRRPGTPYCEEHLLLYTNPPVARRTA